MSLIKDDSDNYDPLRCYTKIYSNLPCGVHFIPIACDINLEVKKVIVYKKGEYTIEEASKEERISTLKHFKDKYWNRQFPTEFSSEKFEQTIFNPKNNMKATKKPVTVEYYPCEKEYAEKIMEWSTKERPIRRIGRVSDPLFFELEIITLEGRMIASGEDVIIRGVNGEIYPCKREIFDKIYDI